MKTYLPIAIAIILVLPLAAQGQIIVPSTTTTFEGSDLTDADDWSDGLPTGAGVGLINIDTNIPSGLADFTYVQTAGALTTGFNRTLGGMTWYLQGGSITSAANLQHVSGNPFAIYVLGGSISANQIRNRDGSLLYIETGSVTISGSTLNMNGGFTTFGLGNGTLTADGLSTDASSRINFLAGSTGSLTIAGFALSNYETLWTQGRLQFDGGNVGSFGDHFQVSGSTLSVIPEPSSYLFLLGGICAMALLRRARKA